MKIIDLFAGCGGLSLGFEKHGFKSLGYLDWDECCIKSLKLNFNSKSKLFVHQDIRESIKNPNEDAENLINNSYNNLDGIIGGPPCQAYSLAGRIRDPNNMKNDYRNYLFESYIEWLVKTEPKFFVFENVTGMLSAKPDGPPIIDIITKAFKQINFDVPIINKSIIFNLADFGGSQNRRRVIIFGVNKNKVKNSLEIIKTFYYNLSSQIKKPKTVYDAIGDLEKLYPLKKVIGKNSHSSSENDPLHKPRFHNVRDIEIFKLLAKDLSSNNPKYTDINSIKEIYKEKVGKKANVHKYYVLRWNEASNLIPAHLLKDGLRHIHPDYKQSRSITMREAARLQNFPDTFKFEDSQTNVFKMIGNAVSPLMAEKIAIAVKKTFNSI